MTEAAAFSTADIETMAREMHAVYMEFQELHGRTPPEPWESLPEPLRASNRDQAASIGDRAAELECTIARRDAVPAGAEEVHLLGASEVERAARTEHARWVAQRRSDGWRSADSEPDVRRRLTPYLVGWDELDDDVRELDRLMIRNIPRFLESITRVLVRWPAHRDEG